MSFLDHYLKKHRLEKMPEKHKRNIEKIERQLEYITQGGQLTFEDCIKQYGSDIADLVERVSNYISEFDDWSFSYVVSTFRFVYNIAIEVYQIVHHMSGCVITDDMSDQEQHDAIVSFGRELVYFIWKTVDPLGGRFTWIPFKQTIEKKIVMWLASMSLESAIDLFQAANLHEISIMDVTGKQSIIKAL